MTRIKILLVDDEAPQRELLGGFLAKNGFEVHAFGNGPEALEGYHEVFSGLAILDMKMPGMDGLELLRQLRDVNPFLQAIVLTAFGSVETAVRAMKAGAFDYLTKPIDDLEELLVKLDKANQQNRLVVEHQLMSDRLAEVFPATEIIGQSPAMLQVKKMISLVAPKDATVLITGPSGSGKELVARGLHALSPRSSARMVAINCTAFPETLLESELFGHEKGAFTGADRAKQGRFELADGGTLMLDEIGEMAPPMQVKLLRVLEEKTVQRLGSVKEIPLDIRIIAATNRRLEQLIESGQFREDLYYRLNVINIDVPALRERAGDVLLLAEAFLDKYARTVGKSIAGLTSEAAELLMSYPWPGNVRELENVIERAIVLTQGDRISADDLGGLEAKAGSDENIRSVVPLAQVERDHIRFCLDQLGWNMTLCAEKLGIHRNTLRTKIKEYNLSKD